MSDWKIRLDSMGKASLIERDGQRVKDVTSIRIDGSVGQVPRVTVTMLARSVEFEVEGASDSVVCVHGLERDCCLACSNKSCAARHPEEPHVFCLRNKGHDGNHEGAGRAWEGRS